MINNIELLAFIRENLSLARTIVIKNENLALSDNRLMLLHYGLDSGDDKSKWRYYLNLNGEYHVTDTMMQVKSLDDNEMIDFTKENLEQHPATKKAYRLGGYYFSRLNAQYPYQADLIQGIINPIPPEESIPADNFQILRYTKEYVNWNETQLIPALQDDINKNAYQFYDTEYLYTDNLMSPALIAVMEKCVFEFLLECRFENRQTRHAHPFYIWSYLQSRGISPIYKDLLNERQTMWLFRNIDYVLRNLGKEKTFQELIDILLTERNIPLSKYDLILSTEDMRDTLKPEPYYFSKHLNLIEKKGNGEGLHKVSTVMLKENPESLDNEINYGQYLPTTREQSAFGVQATYPIKVLDSELVDTTNRKPETIYNLLNNELIYLAGNDLYNINLDIEEPRTGIHHRVTVKEAIVMWHHLFNLYNGAECDTIHKFYYQGVLRITPPKLDELLDTGTKPFITSEWCKDLLKSYIPQIRIVSPSIFYENSLSIFNLKWDHQKMYSRWLSIGYYSRRKNAVAAMYETGFISLTDETSYAAFMEKFNINFDGYSKEDYFRLMWELWKKMTGWDQFTHVTVGQIQSGMLGLMKFLSSYTVQYVYQTVMEDGWYEGGIDLFTENPSLLDHREQEGQGELETNTLRWLPVHHRAVTDNEIETYYFENSEFEYWTVITDMVQHGKIMQTPMLYHYDDDDDTGGDNVHDAYTVDMTNKLRNYCGPFPYDLDDLIPTGGSRASDHVLREMIVDSFEGITTAGPWTVSDIIIVNNNLDNKGVANDVDGYDYGKIVKTEGFTKDGVAMNRYYVGFVPALINDQVIKLDLLATHSETGETIHVRFDYNIVSKQNTWSVSFEIPQSVTPETPFEVTPTITGLSLGSETIVEEAYVVDADIAEYLSVNIENGKTIGTFLKKGWPEELPVLYVLRTSNGNSDELLARHYYYMRGLIPSDRYYDPTIDSVFDPVTAYDEADIHAMTLETFTVQQSKKGWEAADLYIRKNADGTVPTDIVKTDYEGIIDFLTPRLGDTPYIDKEVDGVMKRTFRWKYAVAAESVTIPMVLEFRNAETGDVLYKYFDYTPTVLDHNATVEYDLHRSTEYKIPINRMREVSLGVDGYGDNITITNGAGIPTAAEGNDTHVIFSYGGETDSVLRELLVPGYVIKTIGMPEVDSTWGIKVTAQTKAANGKTLTLYPYNLITLKPEQFADYDAFDKPNVKISAWGDYPLYTHAFAGTRFAMGKLENAWEVSSIDISKFIDSSLDALATDIVDHLGNPVFRDLKPTVVVGREKDGNEAVPEGKDFWFTIYALGSREVLGVGENTLTVPAYITFTNPVINETKTLQVYVMLRIINQEIKRAEDEKNPTTILPGIDNHIVPDWVGLPYTLYGDADETLNEGYFFGTELYSGGTKYQDKPVCIWNEDDHTADITMPKGPLTEGKGFRIFNKRTYRATAEELAGSSLQDVTYYPYIDYSADEVERISVPTLADFDFTHLENAFFKGVRSRFVTLYNTKTIYGEFDFIVKSVNLVIHGTSDEEKYIATNINGAKLSSYVYTSGVSGATITPAPKGKEDYANLYLEFIPVNEGTLTLTVEVSAYHNTLGGTRTFQYDIEIDVKPQEGEMVYANDLEPWWAIGQDTYYLTKLINVSGDIESNTMLFAINNTADSQYITARAGINSALSSNLALVVNVKETYSSEMEPPKAIVAYTVRSRGYSSYHPLRERLYFGLFDIKADRLYHVEDITADTLGMAPDVVFDEMQINQSYTERYIYNRDVKGWIVDTMQLQEATAWMNHIFEYENTTVKDSHLFSNSGQNLTTDMTVTAPDDKYYYLPKYGSRRLGTFNIAINTVLSNKHLSGTKTLSLTYTATRKVVASDIKLALKYEALYIGQTNALNGGIINIPTSDINPAVAKGAQYGYALGNNTKYITVGNDPLTATVDAGYVEGEGTGITIGVVRMYDQAADGKTLESATWTRGYRGTELVPNKNIFEKIVQPEAADFDITVLPHTLIEGVACTLYYAYNPASATAKKWTCTDNGLVAHGTDTQDNVMIDVIGGVKFEDTRTYDYGPVSPVPSGVPDGYACGYVTFIPAQPGTQTIQIGLVLDHASGRVPMYTQPLDIEVTVKDTEGFIYYVDGIDPWLAVGKETKLATELTEYGGTISKAGPVLAAVNEYYSDAVSAVVRPDATASDANALYVTALIEFGGLDRSYVLVYDAVMTEYAEGDKRNNRSYYGIITVNSRQVYDLNDLPAALVDFKADIVFEEMEQNTSYVERYSYLRNPPSDWHVSSTKIVEDKTWMNHIFEYDGIEYSSSPLFSGQNYNKTFDYNVKVADDRYFALPIYGSRVVGEQDVTMEVSVYTYQFGSYQTGKIIIKQKRNVVDANIGTDADYDKLYIGESNPIAFVLRNIPRPDLKNGVIAAARYITNVGKMANYITYVSSLNTLRILDGYTSGSTGVKITFAYPYTSRQGAHSANSLTDNRIYRGEVIIPDSAITEKPLAPTLEDLDIRVLASPMSKDVSGSIVFLYNAKVATELGWKITNKGLKVYGTDEQDSVMTTTFFGKKFTDELVYAYGEMDYRPTDIPSDATDYICAYVTFAPAVEGKQTFEVTLSIEPVSATEEAYTLTAPLDIEVGENEGVIGYEQNDDPWLCVGHIKRVSTVLDGIKTGRLFIGRLVDAVAVDPYADNLNIEIRDNYGTKYAYMSAKKLFNGIDQKFISVYSGNIGGYNTSDKRRFRTYYGELTVDGNKSYTIEGITQDVLDFREDIIFENMEQFTSYTERYSMSRRTPAGWDIEAIRVVEDKDWMNHVFEYEGDDDHKNSALFSGLSALVYEDHTTKAPDNRGFALLTYGGWLPGEKDVTITVTIYTYQFDDGNDYQSVDIPITVKRNIVESNITTIVAFDALYAGRENVMTVTTKDIPGSDLKPGIVSEDAPLPDAVYAVGSMAKYMKVNAKTLTIDSSYPVGKGTGILLGYVYSYDTYTSENTSTSLTDRRAYRGEWFIFDREINPVIVRPTEEDLGLTLYLDPVYAYVGCTFPFSYRKSRIDELGWNVECKGLPIYGTAEQDSLMTSSIYGVTLPDDLIYTYTMEGEVSDGLYGGYFRFVPAKVGAQTFAVEFLFSRPDNSADPFTMTVNMSFTSRSSAYVTPGIINDNTYIPIGTEKKFSVVLNGNSNAYIDRKMAIAQPVPASVGYIEVWPDMNSGGSSSLPQVTIKPLKTFNTSYMYFLLGVNTTLESPQLSWGGSGHYTFFNRDSINSGQVNALNNEEDEKDPD